MLTLSLSHVNIASSCYLLYENSGENLGTVEPLLLVGMVCILRLMSHIFRPYCLPCEVEKSWHNSPNVAHEFTKW